MRHQGEFWVRSHLLTACATEVLIGERPERVNSFYLYAMAYCKHRVMMTAVPPLLLAKSYLVPGTTVSMSAFGSPKLSVTLNYHTVQETGTERLSTLPKVTQLASDRAGTQAQSV